MPELSVFSGVVWLSLGDVAGDNVSISVGVGVNVGVSVGVDVGWELEDGLGFPEGEGVG